MAGAREDKWAISAAQNCVTYPMDELVEEPDEVMMGTSFTLHGSFKVFARAVLALNRVGNELYIEPSEFGLTLRSLNCSKSAFGTFMFSKTFFSECDVTRLNSNASNTCRISMKSALSAFKCVKNTEKAVLLCKLYLNPSADAMLMELTHTYDCITKKQIISHSPFISDVIRRHRVPFYECSSRFQTVVDKATMSNCFIIQAKILLELFNRIHHSTEELLIDAKMSEISFKNYITDEHEKDLVMKTEGKIAIADFLKYSIKRSTQVVVSLRELKSMVVFADIHQTPVSIYFDQPGRPIVVALEGDVNYTAEVVLATVIDVAVPCGNIENPVQIIHIPEKEQRWSKRKRDQSPLNSPFSPLAFNGVEKEKKHNEPSSVAQINDATERQNGKKNKGTSVGLPQATSSPVRDTHVTYQVENDLVECNGITMNNIIVSEDNMQEICDTGDDSGSTDGCRSETPPSRGPALLRYIFSLDEPTRDSVDFPSDAKVLAPDSDSESSSPGCEYMFDFDRDYLENKND
ncbi:unnamed protein product [Thelazia callipaeda]|uniref:Cell cycle checkpoint control protein n=1 Tax=Thelazia callipaeda TaxID=103827 RepID=A0A0N5CJK7_THECL|nr:unnamed protein product [Thelazia callipaeda]